MRYLLFLVSILLIVLLSMCAGLPEIPFFNTGDSSIQQAGVIVMDTESPDLYIRAEAIPPTEVRSGRNVNVYFELRNKNTYSLKNIKLTVYDPCIFSGDIEKLITEIKADKTYTFSLKWTAGSTDIDMDCRIKFRIEYDAEYTLSQGIAVLSEAEYEQRRFSGTLQEIPIQSSYPNSPLKILLSFSEVQPFINNEKYYLKLDYSNSGGGVVNVDSGAITIKPPTNVKDFSCPDYSSLTNNKALSFISNRASTSSCSFTASTAQTMDIMSLYITARYKYMLDNSILIKVKRV